jgi:choline dehydrogenase-like flavoprotein
MPTLIYPESRGPLRLASADPTAAPLIDPGYLSERADRDLLLEGMRLVRETMANRLVSAGVSAELNPGRDFPDEASLARELPNRATTVTRRNDGVDDVYRPEPRGRGETKRWWREIMSITEQHERPDDEASCAELMTRRGACTDKLERVTVAQRRDRSDRRSAHGPSTTFPVTMSSHRRRPRDRRRHRDQARPGGRGGRDRRLDESLAEQTAATSEARPSVRP